MLKSTLKRAFTHPSCSVKDDKKSADMPRLELHQFLFALEGWKQESLVMHEAVASRFVRHFACVLSFCLFCLHVCVYEYVFVGRHTNVWLRKEIAVQSIKVKRICFLVEMWRERSLSLSDHK